MKNLNPAMLVVFILVLTGCAPPQEPEIKREVDFSIRHIEIPSMSGKGYNITMSVSKTGDFEFVTLGTENNVLNSASGKLSDVELKELEDFVVNENKFFELPAGLPGIGGEPCLDEPMQYIEVVKAERQHKVSAGCTDNKAYLNIIQKLDSYRKEFMPLIVPPIAERV